MLFSPVTVWLTNVVIFLILLLNIFIYGEPKVALHCDAARAFWKEAKTAGHDVAYWKQSPEGRWEKQN